VTGSGTAGSGTAGGGGLAAEDWRRGAERPGAEQRVAGNRTPGGGQSVAEGGKAGRVQCMPCIPPALTTKPRFYLSLRLEKPARWSP